jgi:predicted enzyme related to lactoylglutathione lyase
MAHIANEAARSPVAECACAEITDDLDQSVASVRAAGGTILRELYAVRSDRRFRFTDLSGNELAVWSVA